MPVSITATRTPAPWEIAQASGASRSACESRLTGTGCRPRRATGSSRRTDRYCEEPTARRSSGHPSRALSPGCAKWVPVCFGCSSVPHRARSGYGGNEPLPRLVSTAARTRWRPVSTFRSTASHPLLCAHRAFALAFCPGRNFTAILPVATGPAPGTCAEERALNVKAMMSP